MMSEKINPVKNYEETREAIGYIPRKKATQADYDQIGFMSGLEVHQQLKTKKKLFCHCPSGIYQADDNYDAEIIRHMRPTLSELGEYDGTALMEFKTRKNIIYRINNDTACTYEVDDTPPFSINMEALENALEISLLSNLNIVGEVHITRKQYLDGSIPTGFQRTAILGVEGELQLRHKKIKLIQLSIEEDACREISDIGHNRTYKTDRLGMPLIETVTYPEFTNPDEVKEGADYIRFLNRSTGKVETGPGSTRADTNVSCTGGTRVEIKGVSSTKWMPDLTHIEAFRQWALLRIRDILKEKEGKETQWKITQIKLDYKDFKFSYSPLKQASENGEEIHLVNLPLFKGILSHYTQPGKMFAHEISDRLKVIACLEKPNMVHTEQFNPVITEDSWHELKTLLHANDEDAQLIIWGNADDIPTALETIEERAKIAFEGVPNETRKSFPDGTTIFERVLPGADRMYPDTDSAPIPLTDASIEKLKQNLPVPVIDRMHQLDQWNVPVHLHEYLLKKNLIPLLEKIESSLSISPKWTAVLLGQNLKNIENKLSASPDFTYSMIYALLRYLTQNKLEIELGRMMLRELYQHPKMDFESILNTLGFKKYSEEEILDKIPFLVEKFEQTKRVDSSKARADWVMGELKKSAMGNMSLKKLSEQIS